MISCNAAIVNICVSGSISGEGGPGPEDGGDRGCGTTGDDRLAGGVVDMLGGAETDEDNIKDEYGELLGVHLRSSDSVK